MTIENQFDHVSGRYISCDDAKIYVEEKGNPDSPLLLMLHGGFGNIEDFNSIVPHLSRKFRLVGIDSRGHGKSDLGSETLSYKRMTDDLSQVVNTLRLEDFGILGFSDGGIVAYRYTAMHDPKICKVVTVGARWEMNITDPAWGMLSGMTEEIWKGMFPASYESYMRINPEPDFSRFSRAVVAMWIDLSADGHPGSMMNQVKSEILVVRGDKDPLTSLESMTRLNGILTNMHYLNIPFAEHVAFNDAPNVFFESIGKFFDISFESL